MGRDREPKHKRSRREGKDLYGTGGPSLERRLHQPPGMHGPARPRRQSEYAKQLREKQKVKRMYGLRERQFQRFHEMAQRSNEPTGLALLKLLERRLDNVVYRFGWARSRPQARQIVNHGQVRVNGLRVDIPSYLVSPGERIQLDPRAMNIPDVQALLNDHPTVPDWLARKNGSGRVVREPRREEIDQDIEEQRIVEFYAR